MCAGDFTQYRFGIPQRSEMQLTTRTSGIRGGRRWEAGGLLGSAPLGVESRPAGGLDLPPYVQCRVRHRALTRISASPTVSSTGRRPTDSRSIRIVVPGLRPQREDAVTGGATTRSSP